MNVPGFPALPGTGTYYYPNDQSARLVWYHDHAIGITRLNAYAGIASAYIIIDDFETALVNSGLLPDLVGIPLVIQDKAFVPRNILRQDPTWRWGDPGDLLVSARLRSQYVSQASPEPKRQVGLGVRPSILPRMAPVLCHDPLRSCRRRFSTPSLLTVAFIPKSACRRSGCVSGC
jgi:FtsP/CotA-like multicopper oxidase with cupredoxin domain